MTGDSSTLLAERGHAVQFYANEDELVAVLVEHVGEPLRDDDATVIVIATPEHLDALRTSLAALGIDVPDAERTLRLLLLDAQDTLQQLMVDDAPDADAFDAVVGGLVRRASSAGARSVRAYGEMVALLWEAGNVSATIELERLWNELGREVPLSLLCGYPASVQAEGDGESVATICHLHTEVVHGAPVPAEADVLRQFAPATSSPGQARRFVAETLLGWSLDGLVHAAVLVVSELATNAVVHARSEFTVGLRRRDGVVRIEVGDRSPRPPVSRDGAPDATGGRGVPIVDRFADRWGHDVVAAGKIVWFDLAASPA
ncbi:MAG: hypothetical protein QOD30_662 [Actinomycetota bacterium]|jgi:hypothetical protein|nr:hypothetical protein [Actinomycetota bacterium]